MSASIHNLHFLCRRLHSLLGLLPACGFLLFHMWANSQARLGPAHFNEKVVGQIQSMNYLWFMEIFVIGLPLLFHALYGLIIWWNGSSNLRQNNYFRNWMWWLQRVSGIGILIFLVLHVGGTRIWALLHPEEVTKLGGIYGLMQRILSHPGYQAAYVVGLALAIFHLMNGLWSMCITWGLTTTPRSQQLSQAVFAVVGLLAFAMGVHGLLSFFPTPATGAVVSASVESVGSVVTTVLSAASTLAGT